MILCELDCSSWPSARPRRRSCWHLSAGVRDSRVRRPILGRFRLRRPPRLTMCRKSTTPPRMMTRQKSSSRLLAEGNGDAERPRRIAQRPLHLRSLALPALVMTNGHRRRRCSRRLDRAAHNQSCPCRARLRAAESGLETASSCARQARFRWQCALLGRLELTRVTDSWASNAESSGGGTASPSGGRSIFISGLALGGLDKTFRATVVAATTCRCCRSPASRRSNPPDRRALPAWHPATCSLESFWRNLCARRAPRDSR